MTQTDTVKATKPKGIGSGTLGQALLVPALAVLSGLIIGAIFIFAVGESVLAAYGALFRGSFGSLSELIEGIRVYFSTGENQALLRAIYPFTESSGDRHALYLRRAFGCGGLSLWIIQYRRRGTVLHRGIVFGVCRIQHQRSACFYSSSTGDTGRCPRRARSGV